MAKRISYCLLVDNIEKQKIFYHTYMNYEFQEVSDGRIAVLTDSPLMFYMQSWEQLSADLELTEDMCETRSICSWIYDCEEDFLEDIEKMKFSGMQILKKGQKVTYLRDENNYIWEMRIE